VARAAAAARGVPLHVHLGGGEGTLLPVPEIQIIGGGAHAHWRTDVQDYLLIATGARSYAEALEITHHVYHAAGELLRARGQGAGVADEGGYWPDFATNEAALALLVEAITRAGYTPGREAALALDLAASEWFAPETGRYRWRLEPREWTSGELIALLDDWCARYPIVSLEDPLADTDWDGWREITARLGHRVQLVGDDLFTTRLERIRAGRERGAANAVLIKPNQVGTVTETIEAIGLTRQLGWQPIVSARSGETEDAFIAHLAVATNAGQLKVGALARGERTAKWNEVLRIARELGARARFAGFVPPRPA
jgi:enolase